MSRNQFRKASMCWMCLGIMFVLAAALTSSSSFAQCPGGGNCYSAHGNPGCDDAACCNTVCGVDPFCCNVSWDNQCATEAADLCSNCGNPAAGNCFQPHEGVGCEDASCCSLVCSFDSFCCTNNWDSLCAEEAAVNCGNCGDPGAGNCYVADSSIGCDNSDCCSTVCATDPFCCETSWDSICAGEAVDLCDNCGNPNAGSCFVAHKSPGCNDSKCCSQICFDDPFCCETEWDGLCVGAAFEVCGNCGSPGAGNCYEAHSGTGCDNSACCSVVCALDPFCCETSWDSICATEAANNCNNCGNPNAGPCDQAHASIGCSDADCCEIVCSLDPFCCDSQWDSVCVTGALTNCYTCGNSLADNCYVAHETPSCNNSGCCATVCAIDSFCCTNSWDSICVGEALELCGNCGEPGAGSCLAAHSGTGCENFDCCAEVCAIDPFCCNSSWDGICANEAASMCDKCPADIAPAGGNNVVNVDDLLAVINSWGPCGGCAADIAPAGGNNVVNVDDLLLVINSWGPCN